ncbi:hypothetical protein [Paramuribaculum intestinale]|uniref:hypothetical protein n=1 Tax=Paramuribaculum intestinale TaxID=2094151 RepID=UPI0025A977B1|nr:hypothetical protein [Paramuribaculum intestinale]
MEQVTTKLLEWIENFNQKVFKQNEFYQVYLIYLRKNEPTNCITLQEIVGRYIKYLVDDFTDGLKERYGMSERLYLPSFRALYPSANGVQICEDKILWLDELGNSTTIENYVLENILECIYPKISEDEEIKRYGIELFNLGGAIFADVFYVLPTIRTFEEFKIWLENISKPESMTPNFTVNSLDKLDCRILFDGDFSELYKIPRSVDVTMIRYLTGWCDEIVGEEEGKVTLSVNITDDNFIVLSYPKTKLYRDYYDEIIDSINRIDLNILGYDLVNGGLYNKAKTLYENKIRCDISGYKDYFISELIEGKQVYDMARAEDSKIWDGCIGSCVMVNVPQNELTKNYDAVHITMGFLIKMTK